MGGVQGEISIIYYAKRQRHRLLVHCVFSHLHLQHLVENGLGQTLPHMSLMGSVDQLQPVLLVWDDAAAPGDLVDHVTVYGLSEGLDFNSSIQTNSERTCNRLHRHHHHVTYQSCSLQVSPDPSVAEVAGEMSICETVVG